jgi:hypothetical protein
VATFEELVAQAQAAPVSGWDFAWLTARSSAAAALPWDYRAEVARRAAGAGSLLDMGTGGGEWLASLTPHPARTVATEGWPPNVPVAARRLRPAGIPVVQDEGAADNTAEDPGRGRLPFRAGEEREEFADVAAVIYYLRLVVWAVPGFTVERFADRLRELHDTPAAWPVTVRHRRFLVVATKPGF